MRSNSKWSVLLTLLALFALLVTACGGQPPDTTGDTGGDDAAQAEIERLQTQVAEAGAGGEIDAAAQAEIERLQTQVAEQEQATEEPDTAEADRTGAWVDTVIVVEEPSDAAAFTRLEAGDIDVYAYGVVNPEINEQVAASEEVDAAVSFGGYDELTFNPSGPEFADGRLNPFSSKRVREAMNWLVDREHVTEELYGGLAAPRLHGFNNASGDYALYADIARSLEAKYAHNPDRANEVITEEMEAMGATLEGDQWTYNGEPVTITLLIRTEDNRMKLGDYVATLLEDIGFTADRQYKTAAEASPCWLASEPTEGCFHIYTGGWITTAVPRDTGGNFGFFYTDLGLPRPLWQAYDPSEEFYEVAVALNNNDFSTMEERRELFEQAMTLSLEESFRVWVLDRQAIGPHRAEVVVGADLYGGIYGSQIWAYTLRREGEVGGSMTIAMPSILTEPWNAIAGTNWIFDQMLIRGINGAGTLPDPFTGLQVPQRVERAEVVGVEGLPIRTSSDWVTLDFAGEIAVPEDAWVDWDAANQRFITAGEKFPDGATAQSMSTVFYPADLFDTITWHDGSPISIGDFVMGMILTLDLGKAESPYFDAAQAPALEAFLQAFKGVRIVSTDPLTIETYTDAYQLDAETNVTTWWPLYAQGEAPWHTLALGLRAEAAEEAAFSAAKAEELEVEQLSYISGPTIDVLNNQLTAVAEGGEEAGWIPFEATLSDYISAEEAAARYANLVQWHSQRGHFWVGSGPFFLQRAFPVEGNVILQRYSAFPDLATKWSGYGAPPIPDVFVDGPSQVVSGEEAQWTVEVTLDDEPYAEADIEGVTYLIFDATGNLVLTGAAESTGDGAYAVTLTGEQTGELPEGSNRLEVVIVSRRVAVPSFQSIEFVTTGG